MKQVLAFPLALLIAAPDSAHALGLGNLERKSQLNQPFSATIELIGPSAEELDDMTVKLADVDRFKRAGIERTALLSQLRFEIVQPQAGPDYIKVTSNEPIKEPFLDFLIEVNWSKGKIFREYTVLLDPPTYNRSAEFKPSVTIPEQVDSVASGAPARSAAADRPERAPARPAPATYKSGDTYGPIRANEVLWSIADRVRPEGSVTIQQMMLALLRANPDAFVGDNINRLRKGQVLRIPSAGDATSVSVPEALAEVERQRASWLGGKSVAAATPQQRAVGATTSQGSGPEPTPVAAPLADDGHLKLASLNEPSAAKPAAAGGTGAPAATDSGEVTVLREQLDVKQQENAELTSKLSESDETIKLLQRQIEITNQELANLQTKLRENPAPAAEPGLAAPAPAPKAEAPADRAPAHTETKPAEATTAPDAHAPTTAPDEHAAAPEQGAAGATATPAQPAAPEHHATGEAVAPAQPAASEHPAAGETAAPPQPAEYAQPAAGAEHKPAGEAPADAAAQAPAAKLEQDKTAKAKPEKKPAPAKKPAAKKPEPAEGTGMFDAVPGGLYSVLGAALAAVGGVAFFALRRKSQVDDDLIIDRAEVASAPPADEPTGVQPAAVVAPPAAAEASIQSEILAETSPGLAAEAPPREKSKVVHDPDATWAVTHDFGEDPLAEVNVYLAYERFDQAEELVKQAIRVSPKMDNYKLRLLEVYYSSGNKVAYEDYAKVLHDAVGGTGPLWESALAMWQEMSPERGLFESASGAEPQAVGKVASTEFVDITSLESDNADATIVTSSAGANDGGLDFVLDAAPEPVVEEPAAANEIFDLSFEAGIDTTNLAAIDPTVTNSFSAAMPDFLDLSTVHPDVPEANEVLEVTAREEPEVLDVTAKDGEPVGLDVTAEKEAVGLDITAVDPVLAAEGGIDFDLGGEGLSLLDVTANPVISEAAHGNILDLTTPGFSTGESETPSGVDLEISMTALNLASDYKKEREQSATNDLPPLELDLGETRAASTVGSVTSMELDALADKALADATVEFELTDLGFETAAVDGSTDADAFDLDALSINEEEETLAEITSSLEDTGKTPRDPVSLQVSSDDLDLDLSLDNMASTMSGNEQTVKLPSSNVTTIDAARLSATSEGDQTVPLPRYIDSDFADELDTKLNLAKAYIELGDHDGALAILSEVEQEGNSLQRSEAQEMRARISAA